MCRAADGLGSSRARRRNSLCSPCCLSACVLCLSAYLSVCLHPGGPVSLMGFNLSSILLSKTLSSLPLFFLTVSLSLYLTFPAVCLALTSKLPFVCLRLCSLSLFYLITSTILLSFILLPTQHRVPGDLEDHLSLFLSLTHSLSPPVSYGCP